MPREKPPDLLLDDFLTIVVQVLGHEGLFVFVLLYLCGKPQLLETLEFP